MNRKSCLRQNDNLCDKDLNLLTVFFYLYTFRAHIKTITYFIDIFDIFITIILVDGAIRTLF